MSENPMSIEPECDLQAYTERLRKSQVEAIRAASGSIPTPEIAYRLMKLGYKRRKAKRMARLFARAKQPERTLRQFFRILIGLSLLLVGVAAMIGGAGYGMGWAVLIIVLGIAVLSGSLGMGL